MTKNNFNTIEYANGKLIILDQTRLPFEEYYIETDELETIAEAIEKLRVRGAPAIGIVAAYAMAISLKNKGDNPTQRFNKWLNRLAATRPTAVNLFWALNEMKKVFEKNISSPNLFDILLGKAEEIHDNDIEMCNKIGQNGLSIFEKPLNVLTHCNTGKLATGGEGTALNVIKTAFYAGKVKFVYVDETRPLLQGSRLTAFELEKAGIPFAIITDSTAAMLMQQGKVGVVITGADRIAVNGDTANKIGTYNLAALCKLHKIPFFIAAPMSTVDFNCREGKEITIEFRKGEEITSVRGTPVTKSEYKVYSPAFDVTPAEFISGIITDVKLFTPPFDFISR